MGKCIPITQKAKSSPYKANAILIEGAGQVGKKFMDYGQAMGAGMDEKSGTIAAQPYTPPKEDPPADNTTTDDSEDDALINEETTPTTDN
jgi:hypothetical protein